MAFIKITAHDQDTNESVSSNFNAGDGTALKESVEEWEGEIPYRNFTLSTTDYIEDYLWDIQDALKEIGVEMV